MTYEEALQSEEASARLLQKFPAQYAKPVLELVQNSTHQLDGLVQHIYGLFSGKLMVGEEAELSTPGIWDGNLFTGTVLSARQLPLEDPGGVPETQYEVRYMQGGEVQVVWLRQTELRRRRVPFSKNVLRRWLLENANKHTPEGGSRGMWVVKPCLAAEHKLPASKLQEFIVEQAHKRTADKQPHKRPRGSAPLRPLNGDAPAPEVRHPIDQNDPEVQEKLRLESARFKEGTLKNMSFKILQAFGATGTTIMDLVHKITESGQKNLDGDKNAYSKLYTAINSDYAFVRVDRGVFAIRVLVPGQDVPMSEAKPAAPGGGAEGVADTPAAMALDCGDPGLEESRVSTALRVAQGTLTKYQNKYRAAKARVDELKQQFEKDFPPGVAHPVPPLPDHLKVENLDETYYGDMSDRKAIQAHSKLMKAQRVQIVLQAEKWVKDHKKSAKKKKQVAKDEVAKAEAEMFRFEAQVKKAQKKILKAGAIQSGNASALKRLADGDLSDKQIARLHELEEKKREKREALLQRKKEREEARARARQEKLDAKRYPIDDMQLNAELKAKAAEGLCDPPADLPAATPIGPNAELVPVVAAVADFLTSFGKDLGITPMSFDELLASLKLPGEGLSEVFQDLLAIVMVEPQANHPSGLRRLRRWRSAMVPEWTPAVWTEVLRRYVLSKAGKDLPKLVWEGAVRLGEAAFEAQDALHLGALLEHLAGDILDTSELRGMIEIRLEESHAIGVERRQAMADFRKVRKGWEEEAKEKRKTEREAARAAKKAAKEREAAGKKMRAEEGGGVAEGSEAGSESDEEDDEDAEPTFELPPGVLEFRGDPNDRKAVLKHKKFVESELARLSREKNAYMKEKAKREAAERKVLAEERRAREAEELAHEKDMEHFDKELAKVAVRSKPLGQDRHYSSYWWNLANQRGQVYVEDKEGKWSAITNLEDLAALFDAADHRGIRERELRGELEDCWTRIQSGMRRAAKKAADERAPPARSSSRLRAGGGPKAARSAGGSRGKLAVAGEESLLPSALVGLQSLQEGIERMGLYAHDIKLPKAGGWKAWVKAIKGLDVTDIAAHYSALLLELEGDILTGLDNLQGKGGMEATDGEDGEGDGRAVAQEAASDDEKLEHEWKEWMENSSSDEEMDVRNLDPYFRRKRRERAKLLWWSHRERAAWRKTIETTETIAVFGYNAAVLEARFESAAEAVLK